MSHCKSGAPIWIAFALALAYLTSGPGAHAQDAQSGSTDALVDLINHERVNAGLLPLARSSELDTAAQAHSVDMVQHNYLDHTGSDGSEPQERADQAGYHVPPNSGWIVVEVISAISGEPRGPVDWWLNDQQHRRVLLNPRWREIGAGYAQGGEYGNYWTALFGCRPGVLPTLSVDGIAYTHTEQCGDPSVGAALAPSPTPTAAATPTTTAVPSPTPLSAAPVVLGEQVSRQSPGPAVSAVRRENSVTVSWTSIDQPTTTDWLGLYRVGNPDSAYQDWDYVSCTKVADQPRPSGSCTVPLPAASGPFEVRLFRNNGYTLLARSDQLDASANDAAQVMVKVSPSAARAGTVVNVEWRGIESPAATDWLGLYRAGDPDPAQVAWLYTGCAQVPLDARQFGSCNVLVPWTATAGTYEVRLFSANGYRRLAVSGPLTVE